MGDYQPGIIVDIGEAACAFIAARRNRMEARRERTRAAVAFYEAFGGDAAYSDDSEHPRGFSAEFIEATGAQQADYVAALNAEKSARQRLYAMVRKREKACAPPAGRWR